MLLGIKACEGPLRFPLREEIQPIALFKTSPFEAHASLGHTCSAAPTAARFKVHKTFEQAHAKECARHVLIAEIGR